jgi:DNA-binding LytR/AlgR family response regulator
VKCYIIEDDKIQQHLIINYIAKYDGIKSIGVFDDAIFLKEKLLNDKPDIIFLDVELPGISGVEFINEVSLPLNTKVIMVTSSRDYAIDAFENDVVDYLLKPVTYERFKKAVDKARKMKVIMTNNQGYMFVRSNGADVKLFYNDIEWIQAASEYVTIHTLSGKHMVYSNMKSILEKLTDKFIRVHRSYIINTDKIDKIHKDLIEINGAFIKISKSYKNEMELISKQ